MKEENVIMVVEALMSESSRKFSDKEKSMKVNTWMMALDDISDEQGMVGFNKAIKTPNEFMISSGKFRELCLSPEGSESIEDEANEAWALVMKNLNAYMSPIFNNSSISEAIRKMGGWVRLCEMLTKEEPFKKKEFIEMYKIQRRKGIEFTNALSGIHKGLFSMIGYAENTNFHNVLAIAEGKTVETAKILKMIKG